TLFPTITSLRPDLPHYTPTVLLPSAANPSPRLSATAPPTPQLSTLSLHDALPISDQNLKAPVDFRGKKIATPQLGNTQDISCRRSEEHTSELQSRGHLVCRLLLEKKKRALGDSPGRCSSGVCEVRNLIDYGFGVM